MPGTFQPEDLDNLIQAPPSPSPLLNRTPERSPSPAPIFKEVCTEPDQYGMFRIYLELPVSIPDEEVPIEEVVTDFPYLPSINNQCLNLIYSLILSFYLIHAVLPI